MYGQASKESLLSFLSGSFKPSDKAEAATAQIKSKGAPMKTVKLILTMDEVMTQGVNRERDMIVEPETKLKEEDPLRMLLYDTNSHNRKRAARIITRHIEIEVRGKQNATEDETSVDLDSSEEEPEEAKSIIPSMSIKEFKERLDGCANLRDKLDRIDVFTGEYMTSLRRSQTQKSISTEDGSKEVVRMTTFDESSSQLKQNKSTERMRRLDSRVSIDPSELFYHTVKARTIKFNTRLSPYEFVNTLTVKGLKELLGRLVESDTQQMFFNIVTKSQTFKLRNDKSYVLLNFTNLCMPESDIGKMEGLYIATRFVHFNMLKEVNLSGNQKLGDIVCHSIVKVLAKYADELEYLNIAQTKSGIKTCEALNDILSKHKSKLKMLNLERNLIDERGFMTIIDALSLNTCIETLNLSFNPLTHSGALLLSRMIRSNKGIRSMKLNGLPLTGQPMHGLSRSLIVNTCIKAITFNNSGLTDADVKEICFSLTVNRSLHLLSITDNLLTKESFKSLHQLMQRNTTLYHIGISGNIELKIEHLENFKDNLPNRETEILKQEDLSTLPFLVSKGLTRYL
mmetsp:Transcript_12319/g.23383  ORF Transcript_12319/g.23383 Transcript_12319/m.23383 type:complete len:569 (+) Transcript_12319:284-1990(+)